MNLPRFKETKIGQPSSAMSMSEYEESVCSIERTNKLKRTFNKLLDIIDKDDKSDKDSKDGKDDEQNDILL